MVRQRLGFSKIYGATASSFAGTESERERGLLNTSVENVASASMRLFFPSRVVGACKHGEESLFFLRKRIVEKQLGNISKCAVGKKTLQPSFLTQRIEFRKKQDFAWRTVQLRELLF